MREVSKIRKSQIDRNDLPVVGPNGTFRVVVECPECKRDTYIVAKWDGDHLREIRVSRGGSDLSCLTDECVCTARKEKVTAFVDFEWRVSDEENLDRIKRYKWLLFIGLLAPIGQAFVIDHDSDTIGVLLAGYCSAGMFLLIAWWLFGLDGPGSLNGPDLFMAYALAVWGSVIFAAIAVSL